MPKPLSFSQRIPTLVSTGLLVSVAFVVSGALLVWFGGSKLWELWTKLRPFLPISSPQNVGEFVLSSLPLLFKIFVTTVSSVAAVLIGCVWAFSGIFETLQLVQRPFNPAGTADPELAAESLRSSKPYFWRSPPILIRLAAWLWSRLGFVSPVSYQLIADAFGALLKLAILALIVGGITRLLAMLPALAKKYFDVSLQLTVPTPDPLYYLLLGVGLVTLCIAITLLPVTRRSFHCNQESVAVKGQGDPHFFLAMVEEGCRLLNARGYPDFRPTRLEEEEDPEVRGSFIESYPTLVRSLSKPIGYLCVPLAAVLIVYGFYRLIEFPVKTESMEYQVFLSFHFLGFVWEIIFGFALVLSGLYFAEWARNLMGVCKFRSAVVFCHVVQEQSPREPSQLILWKQAYGVDALFIDWAKDPDAIKSYRIAVYWAEAESESATIEEPRYPVVLRRTPALDDAVHRIIHLPFHVKLAPDTGAQPSNASDEDVLTSQPIREHHEREGTENSTPDDAEAQRDELSDES